MQPFRSRCTLLPRNPAVVKLRVYKKTVYSSSAMPPVGCRVASVLGIRMARQGGSTHTCRKQWLLETHVPAHTWYSMMTMIAVPAASRISNTCDAAAVTQKTLYSRHCWSSRAA